MKEGRNEARKDGEGREEERYRFGMVMVKVAFDSIAGRKEGSEGRK